MFYLDKGKTHQQAAGNNESVRLGSCDIHHNCSKFSIAHPFSFVNCQNTRNILSDPKTMGERRNKLEQQKNIKQAAELQLS